MDGDSYLEPGTLEKVLPFFSLMPRLGALTTNEIAYINTLSPWYKQWFNLKFGQRHTLFQSHSLSRRVLTLTGRFSLFRTSIVVSEDFISLVENDVITHWRHGKFRFLMGDDKSTWYYLLKNQWEMIYVPDVLCYSLESRDADFLSLSISLPYRWYGNTLRNNDRALRVGWRKTGLFIWICILDQRLSMWTSLVGISGAIVLSIFKSFIYLPLYIAWVLIVRCLQITMISFWGHPVSLLTIPLMLYNQWIGAFIKIHSYFHLSSQKWSKGKSSQQKNASNTGLTSPLAAYIPMYMMVMFYVTFIFVLLLAEDAIQIPDHNYFKPQAQAAARGPDPIIARGVVSSDGLDDSHAINRILNSQPGNTPLVIRLPAGIINLHEPISIRRNNVTLEGAGRDKTLIKVQLKAPHTAAIHVKGKRKKALGRLAKPLSAGDTTARIDKRPKVEPGTVLWLYMPNTDAYLKEIQSTRWNRQYPHIRQTLITTNRMSEKGMLYFSRAVGIGMDKRETIIHGVDAVRGVILKNFTINHAVPGHRIEEARGKYANLFPEYGVDSIRYDWAYKGIVENVAILASGRHPLVFENSLSCSANRIWVDGAWNKGKGGNGYVRLARAHYCSIRDSEIRNIRHIALQWSSSYNTITKIQSGVDINFHGGREHHNQVESISFAIPPTHPWEEIFVTDTKARWAPPTGPGNTVEGVPLIRIGN
jgi:glycosyltransferase Alg8